MKGFKGQARASSKLSPRAFFHKPQTLKCSLIFFTQNLHESTWRLGSLSETTDRDSSLQAICTPDSVSGSQGRSQGQSWTGSLWSSCFWSVRDHTEGGLESWAGASNAGITAHAAPGSDDAFDSPSWTPVPGIRPTAFHVSPRRDNML